MAIKYTLPQFQFLIAGVDYSEYLDSIDISVPIFEPGEILVWGGSFQVSWNREGQRNSLPPGSFSPLSTPLTWRPGLSVVQLAIAGHPLPPMRIERYAYNPTTNKGQGQLTQCLKLLAGSRPSYEPEVAVSAETDISIAVNNLLISSLEEVTIAPQIGLELNMAALTGKIDSQITTRDPVADAQRLCSVNWQWLTVGLDEVIENISGDPLQRPILFTRALNQVEIEPDFAAIDFAAEKVIVTGSREVPDDSLPDCPDQPNGSQDSQGRKKQEVKETVEKFGVLFPRAGTNSTEYVSERIVTRYAYNANDSGISLADYSGIPFDVFADMGSATQFNTRDIDAGTAIVTVTVKQMLAGVVFPQLGQNTSLIIGELTVQTPFVQSRYVPFGTLFPSAGTSTTLTLDRRETLTSERVPETPDHTGAIDPRTGRPGCLEKPPAPEPPQSAPEIRMKTEAIRGECNVQPTNWTPIRNRPHIVDFGFIPDQAHADMLACQIAYREARRRDSYQVQMPIPIEWLEAGCPLLARCRVDDAEYQMDGLILSLKNTELKFSFSGARVGTLPNPIAPPAPEPLYVPTGSLQLLGALSLEGTTGIPIQSIQLRGGR
jgi:hypothetical protein